MMKYRVIKNILCIGALQIITAHAYAANSPASGQEITRIGTQNTLAGPEQFFTGYVQINPVWAADEHINTSGAYVSFSPGARSAWHTHPAGQRLVIISGVGLVQEWGKPIQAVYPGDVVNCPPGVKHWHGAAPNVSMTHLAVTGTLDGKNVNWMEKVTDEQYHALRAH